jgi:hypothetical protein
MPANFAKLFSGRMNYAWVVLAVMITATMAGVGVRAAPGVMIIPLQRAFGWDVSTISGAISINIILFGATAPFITGLMDVIGPKRTSRDCHRDPFTQFAARMATPGKYCGGKS